MSEWATARGARIDVVRSPEVVGWPDPRSVDAVVALGSDRSVHASTDPWIAPQLEFLRAAHAARVPVLGICFGGQALAAALGGTVAPAPRTEIGWIEVDGDDGYGGSWFTWHEDAFTVPPGASEVARSERSSLAFAQGRHLGIQFHAETTPEIVADWVEEDRHRLPGWGLDPDALEREGERVRAAAEAAADRFFAHWWRDRVGGA